MLNEKKLRTAGRTPENTGRKQDGRFAPGASGNPLGKAKGARHRVTQAVETLLEGEAEALTRKAIELGLAGDLTALRLCLDRIAPARRERLVTFALPKIACAADHPEALAAIIKAVGNGDLTPAEAQSVSAIIAEHRKALETADLEARLTALEGNPST